ncbi:serine hydrolase [Streptomyces sp. NPDC017868]|uniref:serine hydrolase n=1 Tax=Streptomyces sp. NPDC017868 TaxID=3365014 RepID=UPI003790CCDE
MFARDLRTGRTVAQRAGERFPMASVFKTLAVAAVLRDLDHDGEFLARRVHCTRAYVDRSGFSPVTGAAGNVSGGMTVAGLGDEPGPRDRERLTGWMLRNTTSTERFRRGLPSDRLLADKAGSGRHGGANGVGVAWRPDGTPVVLSVLTTRPEEDAPADDPLVARTAALLAEEFGRGAA